MNDAVPSAVTVPPSGIELARAVRATCPDLPVIIVTGYVDTTGFDGRLENAVLLKKPYRMNELGATVEYALQRRGCRRKLSSVVRLGSGAVT
jgi:DNA-binding response OmpR family regulator